MVRAMETEKTTQVQQVTAALQQYETAYNQVVAQYTTLQQQYAQVGWMWRNSPYVEKDRLR